MKTIREGVPAQPYRPVPPRHSCEMELWREEKRVDLWDRFGTILECSCGTRWELRPSGFFRWAVGVGPGNCESRYATRQYWHGLGRDPKK